MQHLLPTQALEEKPATKQQSVVAAAMPHVRLVRAGTPRREAIC